MGLDADPPDPPPLDGPQQPGDYEAVEEIEGSQGNRRREELETFLDEGAWGDGFEEWAAHSDLDEAEFEAALAAGLIEALDFYWEPTTGDVGYRSPRVDELPGEELEADSARRVEEELDDLAHVVSAHLERYVDRVGDEFGFFADRE